MRHPNRVARKLNFQVALAMPFVAGMINAPAIRAQSAISAQSGPATAPKFEVASVKLSAPGRPASAVGVRLNSALFTSSGLPLRNLIYSAYGVPAWRVTGGPAWLDTDTYDIVATLPPNTPKDQINAMLLALLVDRFKLTIRREIRDYPVYVLVAAKEGLKLRTSGDGKFSVKTGRGHLEVHHADMPTLVGYLWNRNAPAADRPVVDMTGLKGFFDITLDWTPANIQPGPADTSPSLFTAIQEQLGLKLEARKSPFEFIVIDSVERPSEN
jgi:uncharacterized protein (TIGR03435 family)